MAAAGVECEMFTVALPADAFAGVRLESSAVARMRDGTRLVADIYCPDGAGPWPVLLMRQPYGRDIASTVVYAHPTWFARRGFLVVVQDVRGRGDSEGTFHAFRNEIEDGFDTVAWAAALPGSNGRVGMYGFSYQGSTQLLAALARPPALRALAPHMTAFDLYSGWFYRDGILQLSTTLAWANQMLREDARRAASPATAALEESWLAPGGLSPALPVRDIAPIVDPTLPAYAAEWLRHPSYDAYWQGLDLLAQIDVLQLPMFHLSGWHDLYLRGSVDGYVAAATTHPDQFLLASPWVHIPWGRQSGGADFGPAAVPAVDEMLAAWFHHWLDHEQPHGEPPLRGCRYFSMGDNQWHDSPCWPPRETRECSWFLQSGGRANSRFGDGRLSREEACGPDDLFNYDPEVPVLAPGGNHGGTALFGPHDLSAQQQGNNLLVYTSAPLGSPLRVAGRATCELHVRSSAPCTDFVVRLSRVTPDDRAIFLTLGAARVESNGRARVVRVRLDPTALRFASGDRIRIDIASSAFPLLIRNPNTGGDPAAVRSPTEFRRALQVVYHDRDRASRLVLPIIEN